MNNEVFATFLRDVVVENPQTMLTFAVKTATGKEIFQTPIIKPLHVELSQDNNFYITGYNLRRLPDTVDEEVSSKDIIRSFRVDRIVPSSVQFLNPAIPPAVLLELNELSTQLASVVHNVGEVVQGI